MFDKPNNDRGFPKTKYGKATSDLRGKSGLLAVSSKNFPKTNMFLGKDRSVFHFQRPTIAANPENPLTMQLMLIKIAFLEADVNLEKDEA
jgi:hypothetical protein